jgi:hypothetical protein
VAEYVLIWICMTLLVSFVFCSASARSYLLQLMAMQLHVVCASLCVQFGGRCKRDGAEARATARESCRLLKGQWLKKNARRFDSSDTHSVQTASWARALSRECMRARRRAVQPPTATTTAATTAPARGQPQGPCTARSQPFVAGISSVGFVAETVRLP